MGSLNFAVKGAKLSKGGPGMPSGPKTQEEVVLKKAEKKKKTREWENLADQVLKRGVQKVADELRGKIQSAGERDERFDTPTEMNGRLQHGSTTNKETQRFEDPVKDSIKEISEEELSAGASKGGTTKV